MSMAHGRLGKRIPMWRQILAFLVPRSIEIDEPRLLSLDKI
jgi:hypothetical protein